MQQSDLDDIAGWIVAQGLAGASETDMLDGFCERCRSAGVPLTRGLTIIDTLHPIYEGRAFRWRGDGVDEPSIIEYGSTREGEAAENWRRTIFHHLATGGGGALQRRIGLGDPADFPLLESLQRDGIVDYLALVYPLGGSSVIGEMDFIYSQWMTTDPSGFAPAGVAALKRLVPTLVLAMKGASLTRIAGTLVEVYLGRDAGRRVLSGRISRGVAERIGSVLWFSDLRGYTAISDRAPPEEIIPLLNDYAEAVISAVGEAGGDVLKLLGDGTLAIFTAEDAAHACRCALAAEASLRRRLRDLNARRADAGRPTTEVYLGLHIGDVFYGNIGSTDRLDFTVVGPAVNEAARIAAMCQSVDRHVVMSSDFVAATPQPERATLVSVGRYALRGVGRAEELFTLDPALLGA